ncbi:MAG: hypothetical protein HY805_08950 [Nitrospirae bacterium]|nr:hypothetical protein [Nitrospirota bacterium]
MENLLSKKLILVTGIIFVMFLLLSTAVEAFAGWGWIIFHERSFKGRVIDAETKEPVEGAVAVAQYHANYLGPTASHKTLIDVQEALTDSKGEFFISSLTRLIYPFALGSGTDFLIWKPGYKPAISPGEFFSKEPGTIEDWPVWIPEIQSYGERPRRIGIVELEGVKTLEERRMVSVDPFGEESDWKKQKQFIRLIREEWEFIYKEPAGNLYKIEEK